MQDFLKNHLKLDIRVHIHVKNATKIGNKTCLIQLENTTDKIEIGNEE
jgi:hypothetical protein